MNEKSEVQAKTREQMHEWLVDKICEYTKLAPSDINETDSIENYGIDSAAIVTLAVEIEEFLDLEEEIEPDSFIENDTITQIVDMMIDKST